MYRGRSSQIGVIKEKCYGSELSKYEGIETKERFRYAPGVGKGSYSCSHDFRHRKIAIGLISCRDD